MEIKVIMLIGKTMGEKFESLVTLVLKREHT